MDTLEELISDAFVAGFMVSSEGYNGEYPFDKDWHNIRRELSGAIQEHLSGSVVGAHRSAIIRELIEKAGAESYTACMAVPDEEPDQAHIAALWLKSQIEGE